MRWIGCYKKFRCCTLSAFALTTDLRLLIERRQRRSCFRKYYLVIQNAPYGQIDNNKCQPKQTYKNAGENSPLLKEPPEKKII